jgi:hypothetical protein
MTTATKMTPAEFLAMEPREHPDFVACNDPRAERVNKTGDPDRVVFIPALVALIRRFGGLDAIPDRMEECHGLIRYHEADAIRLGVELECAVRAEYGALLKDVRSHRAYATLSRLGGRTLCVDSWHPREDFLSVMLAIPADWAAAPWAVEFVSIEDSHTASHDIDRLAAEACDYWIGGIQRATATYCHIRRDVIIP